VSGEQLGGGGLNPVVRIGGTVRRPAGPWTPAVQALLGHLERSGFEAAPRADGVDEEGREILEFMPGEVGVSPSDKELEDVARLVRSLHDATLSFRPPPEPAWQYMVGAPRVGEVMCHNDLSPWNTVWGGEGPRAFIDWDLAAPGPRVWDVAHALWRLVPLFPGEDSVRCGRRLRIFCDAYGSIDPSHLLETVRLRMQALYDTAREWGSAGRPGWSDVWRDTRGEQWLDSLEFLDRNSADWMRVLSSSA
jgi:Ser/Thr protein kinase RdoA (MazF antagonist)